MTDEKKFTEPKISDILDDDVDTEIESDDEISDNHEETDNDGGVITEDDEDDELFKESDEYINPISSSGLQDNVEYYDSDEDEEEEFDKFNNMDITLDLLNEHPEYKSHNIKEVNALCNIIRDSNGNIIDKLHRTIPFITRYEKAKILGERSKQLSYSSVEPMIKIPPDIIDSYEIAKMEYNANAIPFIIRRNLPDGSCEYWKFKDLEKIIFD